MAMQAKVADDGVDTMQAICLTIPAKPEYITLGRLALAGLALLRPQQLSAEVVADVKLALTEACTNSVRHAYAEAGGVVAITYELHRDSLVVEVVDKGGGFEPGPQPVELPTVARDDLSVGGLGLAIIDALSDELAIGERVGGGSTLRFVKRLS
jgi:serine/threonine-protein kinase RsbW